MTTTADVPQLRSVHRQMRFATPRVIAALMVREMTTTYGRKAGGYLWTIVEPIAGIALLSWIFVSMGLRHPGLGLNFPIFYATGLLPYTMCMAMMNRTMTALTYSRALLAYPRVTMVDALVARIAVNLMTQVMVAYIMLGGIRFFWDTGTQLMFGPVLLGFGMAAGLGVGLGLLQAFLSMRFEYWGMIWGVITRPLLILSGVMFVVDPLPHDWRDVLLWNPIVHAVAEVRRGFYHGYHPDYVSPLYVAGVALTGAVVGLLFLWRTHRDLLER